jgi:tetratricopeptide (TPR) repeat protein
MRTNHDGGKAATFLRYSANARPWPLALLAAAAILLAYARVWHADFIWDDDAHVYTNPVIVGPLGLREIWTSAKANYFPLTMTSFWVQHALWGLSPAPYHVVCVLFHVAGALVLWQVLRRLEVPGAWLGAMLWALHPVQVESAAWISELKNTQSGFFYLLSVLFFVRWMERDQSPRADRDYLLSVIAAILAILSKSSTVMLPVVLGLIGWWRAHRRWRDVRWLTPFLAVSLIASGWTIWEQKVNSMASGPEWDHGLAARFMIAGKVPWFYLGKLLWPEPLIFIYPRWDVNALGLVHWIPLLGTIALGVWLFRERDRTARGTFVALAYFFVSLFPVLGLFDVFFFRYSFVGDHFQYLASMGPMVLIGAGLATAGKRFGRNAAAIAAVAALALLTALTWLTRKQTAIYDNREALWSDTVHLNPRAWIARVNLGAEFNAQGRPIWAVPQFEAALELKPVALEVELNLGNALLQSGKPDPAIPHLERALQAKLFSAETHNSLGVALNSVGRTDQSISHFEAAVAAKPDYTAARLNYGNALLQTHRLADSIAQFEAALRSSPRSAQCHTALARALLTAGDIPNAVEHYRSAATLDPGSFEAQCNLANLLVLKGEIMEAIDRAAVAVRLRPDSSDAHYFFGNALIAAGRSPEAVAHLESAVRLQNDNIDAHDRLAAVLYGLQRPGEAALHYEFVVKARPSSAHAHNNIASALMQSGRLNEALKHFETAVQLAPDNVEARFNFALALAASGQLSEAVEQCRMAVRFRPDFKAAQAQLQLLEARARSANGKAH